MNYSFREVAFTKQPDGKWTATINDEPASSLHWLYSEPERDRRRCFASSSARRTRRIQFEGPICTLLKNSEQRRRLRQVGCEVDFFVFNGLFKADASRRVFRARSRNRIAASCCAGRGGPPAVTALKYQDLSGSGRSAHRSFPVRSRPSRNIGPTTVNVRPILDLTVTKKLAKRRFGRRTTRSVS
jgi:hypothetical protein